MVATQVSCFGGANAMAAAIPGGGTQPYSYLWSDFSTDSARTGLLAGKYSVLLIDSAGCRSVDSINITQPSKIAIMSLQSDVSCFNGNNGSISVTDTGGTPGYSYSWSTGSTNPTIDSISAGIYTVVVTDLNSCTVAAPFEVTQPTQIQTTFISIHPNCFASENGSISVIALQGVPPYSYQWNTTPAQTSATASELKGGAYTVTVMDANSCTVASTDTLSQPDSLAVSTNASASKCYDVGSGQVIANVTGGLPPYVYELAGQIQTSDTFNALPKGNYVLLVTDGNGCDGTGAFTIGAPAALTVSLAASEQIILTGMQTQLIATATDSAPIVHYYWSPLTVDSAGVFDFSSCPDTTDCSTPYVMPPVSTIFTVTVEDADSCFASDTITIFVNNQPVAFIPNAFTPNGDGLNDRFEFSILGASTIEVTIYNRWGQQIYYNPNQTNGMTGTDGWDGTLKGKPEPDDTYVYQIKVTYFDNTVKHIAGTIAIMR
jgi:gliding motility-associated-like protein